jgi:hypothetical protein
MVRVAIAGFGYNGGQVIFKLQREDNPAAPTIYKQVAENCKCCCLPPARVKITLVPGKTITSISPGEGFTGPQQSEYAKTVADKIEEKLTFVLENIPCPIRSKWTYYYSLTPPGASYICSIYLNVPRCRDYGSLQLVCAAGTVGDALNPDTSVFPPPLQMPLDGIAVGPLPYVNWFRFIGFDDHDNSGFPAVKLCVENICKLYDVQERTFKVPCFRYEELGATGLVNNGVEVGHQGVFDWPFFAPSDGSEGGKLAYFQVEFEGDLP